MRLRPRLDAVLLDVGGTLVREAPPHTPVADLRAELLPRVQRDLSALASQVPLAAVTNTGVMKESDVRRLLEPTGINPLLAEIVTSAEAGAPKPDPATVHEALRRLGVTDPSRALVVGDLGTDLQAAASAGCPSVLVGPEGVGAAVDSWWRETAGERFFRAAARDRELSDDASREARRRHDQLTKPAGSLGRLEDLSAELSAMAGVCPPPAPRPTTVAVFAADNGVAGPSLSPWAGGVTAAMVRNFSAGGAAVSVMARQLGVDLLVVDVGVAGALPALPRVLDRRIAEGARDLSAGPAMTVTEALTALDVGTEIASRCLAGGAACLLTGDMGIGNTTSSAALIAALTGAPAGTVTGRGSGIDEERLSIKKRIVQEAVARSAGLEGVELLAEIGGLEIAALAGYIVAGASAGVPVVLDGVVTNAAALVAERLAAGTSGWCIAGHLSTEPGARVALDHLRLRPLLDLGLRLGEGTGGLLALPIVEAAARTLAEMATFGEAGVPGVRV